MKWLLTITTLMVLAGCSASAQASVLANDAKVVAKPVTTKAESGNYNPLKQIVRERTLMEKAQARKVFIERQHIKLNNAVKKVISRVGKTPYVFSGSSIYGWDCSGLVRWTYEQVGIELEHSATKQGNNYGHRVKTPKYGDIVVFGWNSKTEFYHSAIYIGNNKIVHANRGYGGTHIEPLSNYKSSTQIFIRVIPDK